MYYVLYFVKNKTFLVYSTFYVHLFVLNIYVYVFISTISSIEKIVFIVYSHLLFAFHQFNLFINIFLR